MAHPVCTRPTARPRYLSRMTSPISTAPAAHSPPKPSPCKARKANNCSKFWAKAQRKVKMEYHRIVICNMRTRPNRSASAPENHPPNDEISRVTVPIRPASPRASPHTAITVGITRLYICTSNASKAQPPKQPPIVRRSLAFKSVSQASIAFLRLTAGCCERKRKRQPRLVGPAIQSGAVLHQRFEHLPGDAFVLVQPIERKPGRD